MRHEHERSCQYTGAPPSRNSSSNNQSHRIGCSRTYKTSELKDEYCCDVRPFDREKREDGSVRQLKHRSGDQVGAAVPAHVRVRVEFVGDVRYRLSKVIPNVQVP